MKDCETNVIWVSFLLRAHLSYFQFVANMNVYKRSHIVRQMCSKTNVLLQSLWFVDCRARKDIGMQIFYNHLTYETILNLMDYRDVSLLVLLLFEQLLYNKTLQISSSPTAIWVWQKLCWGCRCSFYCFNYYVYITTFEHISIKEINKQGFWNEININFIETNSWHKSSYGKKSFSVK
jgi:hypothetical protein